MKKLNTAYAEPQYFEFDPQGDEHVACGDAAHLALIDQCATHIVGSISSNLDAMRPFLSSLTQKDWKVSPVAPSIFQSIQSIYSGMDWGLLVVCADDFESLDAIIDCLLFFREKRPKVPVILISEDFRSDDLSCERLAIADICLRKPGTENGDIGKVAKAFANNLVWQDRMEQSIYVRR